jgi:hypothetical protein
MLWEEWRISHSLVWVGALIGLHEHRSSDPCQTEAPSQKSSISGSRLASSLTTRLVHCLVPRPRHTPIEDTLHAPAEVTWLAQRWANAGRDEEHMAKPISAGRWCSPLPDVG